MFKIKSVTFYHVKYQNNLQKINSKSAYRRKSVAWVQVNVNIMHQKCFFFFFYSRKEKSRMCFVYICSHICAVASLLQKLFYTTTADVNSFTVSWEHISVGSKKSSQSERSSRSQAGVSTSQDVPLFKVVDFLWLENICCMCTASFFSHKYV